MKNKLLLISIAIIILMTLGSLIFKQSNNPIQKIPSDFNLIFKYGVGAKNELNTFDQTYTKDMVADPSVTIKLKLTDQELTDIYKKISDLKLSDHQISIKGNVSVTPCSSYYLKIQNGSDPIELLWDDCHGKISDKFQQFTNYILSIIESKEEYKSLPTPKSAYL